MVVAQVELVKRFHLPSKRLFQYQFLKLVQNSGTELVKRLCLKMTQMN